MQQQNQQQQQQPPQLLTTEQIQKYLEENKQLIMAILESQNMGKLTECAQYQAQLQKNLMYLAAVADAQPPPSGPSQPQTQTPPAQPTISQGPPVQPMQPSMSQQQASGFGPRMPFPHQQQQLDQQQLSHLQHQQQQAMAEAMGMRMGGNSGWMGAPPPHMMDARIRHDGSEARQGGANREP